MPELSDEPTVAIAGGRHPLLDERAVPQSLTLGEQTRLLVISGPNMGGKTVALKMTGLFVVMAYCGMQVPAAAGTCIGRFERVVADIGDEQSLVANTSTFSAHLQRMREVMDGANSRTLAIVDEIGGGTEPTAGVALAIAMLEWLLASGARAIVSTHSTELKLFAHATPGVANASVRFDPATFEPTFELDLGAPGQSLAFPLAARLGISAEIVERATALMEDRERDYEAALAELALRNSELREERLRFQRERHDLAGERELVARDRADLDAAAPPVRQRRRRTLAAGASRFRAGVGAAVGRVGFRANADSKGASNALADRLAGPDDRGNPSRPWNSAGRRARVRRANVRARRSRSHSFRKPGGGRC